MKHLICFIFFLGLVATGCGTSSSTDAGDVSHNDTASHPDTNDAPETATDADVAAADTVRDDNNPTDTVADTDSHAPDVADDAPADTHDETPTDAAADVATDTASCVRTWMLTNIPADSVQLADPAPLNVGRTVRLQAFAMVSCNQQRAMPLVTIDQTERTITLQIRNWEQTGFDCAGADFLDSRMISVVPATAGSWHVKTQGGTDLLVFDVAAAPDTGCEPDGASPCDQDCDCSEGVCLGGSGLIGPFTSCARPCEVNADCPGGASCISADDGLESYCSSGTPACGPGAGCPTGFKCEGSACVPTYTLNQTARKQCRCNDDCPDPLRCVEPTDAEGVKRCEYTCPGAGAWCPSGHICGTAAMDVSGLAQSDSVCGWVGE